jgi:Cu-Zn family superoxide dismutase
MKALILMLLVATVACGHRGRGTGADLGFQHQEERSARAELQSGNKRRISGDVYVHQSEEGIRVLTVVRGLEPRKAFGMHFHEEGKCERPGFESAGEHFDPYNNPHGGPASHEKHPGDLGNIVSDAKGVARKEVMLTHSELKSLEPFLGRSVIVHSRADDLVTQPTGDAGDRIACGILKEADRVPAGLDEL